MRLVRIFILALTVLSLPGYGFAASHARDCSKQSTGYSMSMDASDACCSDTDDKNPCKSPNTDGSCGSCQIGAAVKSVQTDGFAQLALLSIVPFHEVIADFSSARFTSHSPDGLLRPPTRS